MQHVFCYRDDVRPGDQIWRRGGRAEDLQLGFLFSFFARPACSLGMTAGVGGWDNVMSGSGKVGGEGLGDPIKKGQRGKKDH